MAGFFFYSYCVGGLWHWLVGVVWQVLALATSESGVAAFGAGRMECCGGYLHQPVGVVWRALSPAEWSGMAGFVTGRVEWCDTSLGGVVWRVWH